MRASNWVPREGHATGTVQVNKMPYCGVTVGVVTQDYGLASLLLPKGCTVLHHKGFEYDARNIDHLLETRYMGSMIRKGGGRTKGPKPFSKEDKEAFLKLFRQKIWSTVDKG